MKIIVPTSNSELLNLPDKLIGKQIEVIAFEIENPVSAFETTLPSSIPSFELKADRRLPTAEVNYSLLNDFTGFISAALILWKLTVSKAIVIASAPAATNIHQARST